MLKILTNHQYQQLLDKINLQNKTILWMQNELDEYRQKCDRLVDLDRMSDEMMNDMKDWISTIDSDTARTLILVIKSFKFEYVKQSIRNIKTEIDSAYTNGWLNIIEYFHKFFSEMIKKDYQDKITWEKMYADMVENSKDQNTQPVQNKTEKDSNVAKRKKRLAKS